MSNNNENIKGIVESQIISKIISTKSMYIAERYELTPQMFDTPIYDEVRQDEVKCNTRDIYSFIASHYEQFNRIPDEATVLARFPDFTFIDVTESDDYLVNTLINETREKNLTSVIMQAQKIHIEKGYKAAAQFLKSNADGFLDVPVSDVGIDIIHEGADQRLAAYKEAEKDPNSAFISTGLKELDEELGGFCRSEELVFIQARTGQAKTFLLLKTLFEASEAGEVVGLYEPELSSNMIGYRYDSYKNQLSNFKLKRGLQLNTNYETYINDLKKENKNFFVFTRKDFQGAPTVSKLKALCRKKGITVLGVDGVQVEYFLDERAERDSREDQKLCHIADDLLTLSKDLSIPVIAAIQSQRVPEDTELDINTVKGGYTVSQVCTLMLTLKTKDRKSVVRVVKNRTGEFGKAFSYQVDLDKGIWNFEGSESSIKANLPDPTRQSEIRQKSETIQSIELIDHI